MDVALCQKVVRRNLDEMRPIPVGVAASPGDVFTRRARASVKCVLAGLSVAAIPATERRPDTPAIRCCPRVSHPR